MRDSAVFLWDKRLKNNEVKHILKDPSHPRFIETAALLLSRINEPKLVFAEYLNKVEFCRNWQRIKRRMRQNRWNDSKIIFWDEIYRVLLNSIDKSELRIEKQRLPLEDFQIKEIFEKIRHARKQVGWTQRELAARTHLSQQAISSVEQGYVYVSLKTLKKITDALGLKISVE